MDGGEVGGPAVETRPQLDGRREHRRRCRRRGEEPFGAVQHDRPAPRRLERHQRAMPHHLVPAEDHRGVAEPVAEGPPGLEPLGRPHDVGAVGARPVEHRLVVVVPDLAVARQRLVVQPHGGELGREQDARHRVLAGDAGELVLVALDPVPPAGALERRPQQRRVDPGAPAAAARLVDPAGLRHAQAVRRVPAAEGGQQRDLQRARQRRLQPEVRLRPPERQAAGERQQVDAAGEIACAHRLRQRAERAEREQVAQLGGALVAGEPQRVRPGRERLRGPRREVRVRQRGQHAEPAARQGAVVARRLAVRLVQQPQQDGDRLARRPLDAGAAEGRRPEGALGALLARAEQRPAHPPLVVLGPRQRQRQQHDMALVGEPAGAPGELGRPERVAREVVATHAGDVERRLAAAETRDRVEQLRGDGLESGPQLDLLLRLVDPPAVRIAR